MPPVCELCHDAESKYTCPACGLRYCSVTCFKPHRLEHESSTKDNTSKNSTSARARVDRPGTTQRVSKPTFNGFENDAELKRLLMRYPALKTELQGIFALTLDPGPEETRSWNKIWLPLLDRPSSQQARGSRGRVRSARGRGGMRRGGYNTSYEPPEGRQPGQWTKEKGDLEALFVMKKVQSESERVELSEGLQEFVELVRLRFGDEQNEQH